MRWFVRVRDNPAGSNYGQSLSLHRFSEDGKVAEFWNRENESWDDGPGIIRFTGIGGETDAFEVDEAMAFRVFQEKFGGDPEMAKEAMGLDYVPVDVQAQVPSEPAEPAPEEPEPEPEPEVRGALRRLHYGPGDHPGSGSPQQAHAGGDEGGRSQAQEAKPSRIAGVIHPTAKQFRDAIERAMADSPFRAHVSHHSEDELRDMKALLLTEDGTAGIAVKDHGDGRIEGTALFNGGDIKGIGRRLLLAATEDFGVNYVEAFGPRLPGLYEQVGFRVTETVPFDPEQAPEGWDRERWDEPYYAFLRREGSEGDEG